MSKRQIGFLISFVLLFALETLIALFVNDAFIRPYMGDVLVVVLLYCFICIFRKKPYRKSVPLYVLLFALFTEFMQYIKLVDILHIENRALKIIIGNTFSVTDILCYAAGTLITALTEILIYKAKREN